ncbi:unnamed protein product [Vicia faba]|uniref:Glycine-rich protein n=1 Tax=Vicia faba TaxID=3906 RepID=A0AAV0YK88_VICFA|nr:unnamed protein product [Vicia faba]
MILIISSEVSARDLTKTSSRTRKEMVDEKTFNGIFGHGGYYVNGYNGGYPHYGGYIGGYPRNEGGYDGGYVRGYPYNGGRFGGGYPDIDGGYNGGEVVDGQTKDNTHN